MTSHSYRASQYLITIVIPTFNSGRRIERCLQSILAQRFSDYEIVVVDGGSTDQTCQRVEMLVREGAPIVLHSEKDEGVYDAMNRGVNLARGDWLLFLGSDDELYSPTVLAEMAAHLTPNVDLVYGNVMARGASSWAQDGAIYDGPFDDEKILERNICHQSIFYARSLFAHHGGYDLTYKVLADWEYNLRIFRSARKKYVDTVVAAFEGGGLSTGVIDHEFLIRLPEIAGRYFSLPFRADYYRRRLDSLRKLAQFYWKKHSYYQAFRFFWIWLLNSNPRSLREQMRRA